tara:strand:- start:424 stop:1023 length:600 start_codon:yes stop_codon:yes gene_type:complete
VSIAFAFDLDGTVTCEELLPLISKELNLEEELGFLTDLTINSLIPFEMSFKLRYALLKTIKLSKIKSITRKAKLDPFIEKFIKKNDKNSFIVTGNVDHWIDPIIKNLGCNSYSSKARLENDYCTELIFINNKAEAVKEIRKNYDFVVAVGEGANDKMMFQEANISICYGGVHSPHKDLLEHANYLVNDGETLCRLLNTL